jgi:6,7-dimethyl-8-ribityllumazine synthase
MMSRILIVRATFYPEIGDLLLDGASAALKNKRAPYEVLDVPGAMESPLAMAGASSDFDGYLALGCVIRGETSHYDVVCQTSAYGLMTLALSKNIIIINGILTTENWDQAIERAHPAKKNKGGYAAQACMAMIHQRDSQ